MELTNSFERQRGGKKSDIQVLKTEYHISAYRKGTKKWRKCVKNICFMQSSGNTDNEALVKQWKRPV